MINIDNYKKIPTGKAKDYSNQLISNFLVLYRIEQPIEYTTRDTYWIGQCQSCKQYKILTGQVLRRGKIQCDCEHDLTGKKFGRLTVQYYTGKTTKNRQKIWHCKCECGNEKNIDAWTLTSGQSKSCGCYQKEIAQKIGHQTKIDITGQRFGKLVALYPINTNKNGHTKWHCHCDCGNEVDIDLGNLKQGFSKSCGCLISTQEERIIKLLNNAQIPFKYQHRFKDLSMKSFDFYIDNKYIVEFDGEQHFHYNGYGWNTKDNFKKTIQSDTIKNEYCFNHNIPIIRIPYYQKNLFNLNDLKLETTRFLLTRDNVKEYYKDRDTAGD